MPSACEPKCRCSSWLAASDSLPGTSKPPPVRCSVCLAAKGSASSTIRTQAPTTQRRRRPRKPASLFIESRMSANEPLARLQPRSVSPVTPCPASLSRRRRLLLGDEQEAGRGGAGGEGAAVVARGVRERLQGEAVAEREEIGDDGVGVEAHAQHALAFLGPQDGGDVRAGALEELADLALDVGVAAAGAEQLVEQQEEARLVLDQVGEAGDEHVEHVVDALRLAEHLVEAGDPQLGGAGGGPHPP